MSTKSRDWVYKKVREGSIVGRLTVMSLVGVKKGNRYWNCSCSCGNTLEVIASSLNSGLKQSCGCLLRKRVKHVTALMEEVEHLRTIVGWP